MRKWLSSPSAVPPGTQQGHKHVVSGWTSEHPVPLWATFSRGGALARTLFKKAHKRLQNRLYHSSLLDLPRASAVKKHILQIVKWFLLLPTLTSDPPLSHRSSLQDSYELPLYIKRNTLGQNLYEFNVLVLLYIDLQGVLISQIMTLFSCDLQYKFVMKISWSNVSTKPKLKIQRKENGLCNCQRG